LSGQRCECNEGNDRNARGGGKKKTLHADMIVEREATDEPEIRRIVGLVRLKIRFS
jgi:hypothetical protein